MTNSFRPQASPVDTFVSPSTVAPTTGFDQLVNALKTVNPSINKYFDSRIKEEAEEEKQRGMEMVIQASQSELRKIISKVKKKDGDKAARQLIGGNIFTQAGVEKQLAINLGNTAQYKTKLFFDNYKVQQPNSKGEVIQKSLAEFDINSDEFQKAVEDYRESNTSDVSGIRSLYVNEYFVPQQSKALAKIFTDQVEKHNEFKAQKAENQLSSTILLNFNGIDDNGIKISRDAVQQNIERLAANGLTEAVSPNAILDIVKSQANNIFLRHKNEGLDGFEAANNFLEFVGDLKVGPRQTLKDGSKKQGLLRDFYDEDIIKLQVDFIKANNNFRDEEERKYKETEEKVILGMLEKYSFTQADEKGNENREVLESLIKTFPGRFDDFIEPQIQTFDFSRDEFFRDFEADLFNGKYESDRESAYKELMKFEKALGITITQEDRNNLTRLKDKISTTLGKDLIGAYRSQITDVLRAGEEIIGEKDRYGNFSVGSNEVPQYRDAANVFNTKIKETFSNEELTEKQKETDFNDAVKRFYKDMFLIKKDKYQFKGIMKGLEAEVLKEIQEEEKNDLPPTPDDDSTPNPFTTGPELEGEGKGFDLFMKGLGFGNEKKEVLINKLNEVKQDVSDDEESTGFIDSILNALGRPATAGDLEGKPTTHRVQSGDYLEKIANRYGLSSADLVEANNLENPNVLQIGQELFIPEISKQEVVETVRLENLLSTPELTKLRKEIALNIKDNSPIPRNYLTLLYQNAGFEGEDLKKMVAISLAESRGRPNALNKGSKDKPEESYGISQINMYDYEGMPLGTDRRPKLGIDKNDALYDPVLNAIAAKLVFDEFKATKGDGFLAWSVYSSDGEKKDENPIYIDFLE